MSNPGSVSFGEALLEGNGNGQNRIDAHVKTVAACPQHAANYPSERKAGGRNAS